MSDNKVSLFSLIDEVKQMIDSIKKNGSAFVVDWQLIELLELIIERIESN